MQLLRKCVMTLLFAMPVLAPAAEIRGHLEAGRQYDSNLTVDELDAASEESDQAWVFEAGLDGAFAATDQTRLNLGYSFSGSRYQTFDRFDQDIHLLSVDLSHDFEPITLGASYHYSHATLAGEAFLDYGRSSVYLGGLMGDELYLLASIQDKRKRFDNNRDRDSTTVGVSVDAFVFFNQAQTHVLFGLDGDRENARAEVHDNRLIRFRSALVHRFTWFGGDHRWRLGWRYEDRAFEAASTSAPNPLLPGPLAGNSPVGGTTARRQDRAHILEARWRLGLSKIWSIEPSLIHGRYRSNDARADYDRTLAVVNLRAEF